MFATGCQHTRDLSQQIPSKGTAACPVRPRTPETDQQQRIVAELEKLGPGHPWAGHYYVGDGLGMNVNLVIAPQAGYFYSWTGCLGPFSSGQGSVVEMDNTIQLSGAVPTSISWAAESTLKPIRWNERHYLIATNELISFCNAKNDGREPRKDLRGFFLLRAGDERLIAHGNPELPEILKPYLLSKPIRGRITRVADIESKAGLSDTIFYSARAWINRGSRHGVLPGMLFHVSFAAEGAVVDVAESSCTLALEWMNGDSPPKKGDSVSTFRY